MYKTVCRVETVTRANISRFTYHNMRKGNLVEGGGHIRVEDIHKNVVLYGSADPTLDVKARIEGVKMARAAKEGPGYDIVAQELILSAHSEFFESMSEKEISDWQNANLAFLERRFPGNLVSAIVHRDERAPHIHAVVVPIVDSKRKQGEKVLNATEYLGDRGTVLRALRAQGKAHESTLGKLQTEYTEAMQRAGFKLERGEENSKDKHQSRALFRKMEKQYERGKKAVAELEEKGAALAASVEKLRSMEAQKIGDISKAGAEYLKIKMDYEKSMTLWTANIKKLEERSGALDEREEALVNRVSELESEAARLDAEAVDFIARTKKMCDEKKAEAKAEIAEMRMEKEALKTENEALGIQCAERREALSKLDREEAVMSKRLEELAAQEASLERRCAALKPPLAMKHITAVLEKIGGMDRQTAVNETFAYMCTLERPEAEQLCAQFTKGQKWLDNYDRHKAEQAREVQEAEREAQRQSRSHGRCR